MTPQKARFSKEIRPVCTMRYHTKINHRKEFAIMKQSNKKTASGVMLTQAQRERCDRLATEQGCRSRNPFIRDAVDFYCSWLEKDQSERFLTPALGSVISAKIRDSEERINRNLSRLPLAFPSLQRSLSTRTAAVTMKIISPSFAVIVSVRHLKPTALSVRENASSKEK